MSGMLERFENSEAVLLMYLAGELSEEERLTVERMLAADASLRAAMEELRAALEAVSDAIGRLDAAEGPVPAEAVIRRTVRRMRQYRVVEQPVATAARRQFVLARWPVWARAAAGVAAVIVVALGLWGVGLIDFPPGGHGQTEVVETSDDSSAILAAKLEKSFAEESTSLERAELEAHAIREEDWFFRHMN